MEGLPRVRFFDAIKKAVSNFKDYRGRSRRSEFWFWVLGVFLIGILVGIIIFLLAKINKVIGVIAFLLFVLCVMIFSLPLGIRRFHDIGKSGWFILLGLLPIIGQIVLIYFYCQDSVRETNKWGESPKYSSNPGERKGLLDSEEIKI